MTRSGPSCSSCAASRRTERSICTATDRVRQACRVRHFSRRTEEAYAGWIRRFILFHRKRHPDDMGSVEVSTFLSWLAQDRHVSASTQNQALSAVLFLYREVLGRDLGTLPSIARARTPERLPVVLSRDEVSAVLAQSSGVRQAVDMEEPNTNQSDWFAGAGNADTVGHVRGGVDQETRNKRAADLLSARFARSISFGCS